MRIRAATNGPHESLRGKGVGTKIPRQRLGSSPEAGFPARGGVLRQRRGSPPEAGFPAGGWVPPCGSPPASRSQSISSNGIVEGRFPPTSAANSCNIRLTSSREGTSRCDSPSRTLSSSTSALSSATFPFSFWTSASNSSITLGHSGSHSSAHSGHAQFRLRIAEPGIDKRHGDPSICFLATFPGSSMKGRKWTWNSSSSCLSNSRARAASRAA